MRVITSIKEMQEFALAQKAAKKSVGFVPTMGYLHEGHATLFSIAKEENEVVVVSVFVNPLQFGPNEDFEAYPRDFEHDEKIARDKGVDVLFYPGNDEMYPHEQSVTVIVKSRVDVLCGRKRPGHFDGVATILVKLFNIVLPERVYFGTKDAQQVAVVDGLVSDFNFPIEIKPVDTVREEDGLAKSSRNVYLSPQERAEAPRLYEGLVMAKMAIENGERNPETVISLLEEHLANTTSGDIDYIEIYRYPELESVSELSGKIIIAVAVKFTKARLIDNITVIV